MFSIGLTDHLEGPPDQSSSEIFDEVSALVRLADELGVRHAWFTEHHSHAHHGHLPTPLLYALHLAGQTRAIQLGTAVICLNLHHPLDVAEQVAVADTLTHGRLAPGFGSGSTPEEFALFGLPVTDDADRHARFQQSLRQILSAWGLAGSTPSATLPRPRPDLLSRSWIAVNSAGSARIAGALGFNILFSHLRTPAQYQEYASAYRSSGGLGLIAANRPVFVGPDDATAFRLAEPALRTLWRRFQSEGKIPADLAEPSDPSLLCAHPINFLVGGPQTVADSLLSLHRLCPFDVANLELRWAGLPADLILDSLRLLMTRVVPLLDPSSSDSTHPTLIPSPPGRGCPQGG